MKSSPQTTRDINLKIPDIKVLRSLSKLLAKLDIYFVTKNPPPPHPWSYSDKYPEYSYGIGLAEAKAWVEMKFTYVGTNTTKFDGANTIHVIKRVRQTMNMLNKLGLTSPDAGLAVCKAFVLRRQH